MNMIKRVLVIGVIGGGMPLIAMKDHDFDGVSDRVDECPNTPFLSEVNAQGCSVKPLILPNQTESDSLVLTLGYGVNTNEDLVGREEQHSSKVQLGYYLNNWSYSLTTGYYIHAEDRGSLDTLFKVKKRFKLTTKLKLRLGVGVKLPTYDFVGNGTDYILYSSLNYYINPSLSFFTRYNYSWINDEDGVTPLQDAYVASIGVGYFFTKKFYTNLSYSKGENKFTNEHTIESLSATIYYKLDKKWFGTLFYDREINDEDFHETINLKVGYKVW
jgi:hypothetical protein